MYCTYSNLQTFLQLFLIYFFRREKMMSSHQPVFTIHEPECQPERGVPVSADFCSSTNAQIYYYKGGRVGGRVDNPHRSRQGSVY